MKSFFWIGVTLIFVVTFLPLLSTAQSPAIPTSPFTPAQEKSHSFFTWDYSILNEASGWWGYWYPSCSKAGQSPINIVSANAAANTNTLVIQTTTNEPLSYVGTIITFQSLFNQIFVDISMNQIKLNIFFKSQSADPPEFLFESIEFFFPSVHQLDGNNFPGEMIFQFQGNDYDPDTSATGTNIKSTNTISLSYFLEGTADDNEMEQVEAFLSNLYYGAESGSTRVTPFIPSTAKIFHYTGTHVHPPCQQGLHHFISAEPLLLKSSTITKFAEASNSPSIDPDYEYRSTQPLGTRVINTFSLDVSSLLPIIDADAKTYIYQVDVPAMNFTGILERHAVYMLVGIVAVLGISVAFLLFERHTYRLPYNLTWTNPHSKNEVFGLPLNYGHQNGHPRVDNTNNTNSEEGSFDDGSESRKKLHDSSTSDEKH